MKNTSNKHNKKGFTIVELMIATVIFSLVMLICLTGMVQVSRAYYKGITHSKTQEAGRLLMDEIAQNIQLSGSAISVLPPDTALAGPNIPAGGTASVDHDAVGVFCAGNKKYTYVVDRKVAGATDEANKEIKNAIISEDIKCTDTLTKGNLDAEVSSTTRSLLGENMRLTKFSITRVVPDASVVTKSGSQMWKIDISIAYGDQDLLSTDGPDGTGNYIDDTGAVNNRVVCSSGTGNEFCSIVELSTIVSRRIG